ncbi:hypothetical protein ACEPAG_7897 [Sanghuangporus baumii]
MPTLTRDQIRHEVINLQKTLNLLERSFKEEDWTRWSSKDRNNKWLKAQSILTGVSHCRSVLHNLTPSDYDYGLGDRRSMSGQQFHENAKAILDHLEQEISEINEDLKPRARLPNPILPTLPRPSTSAEKASPAQEEKLRRATDEALIPIDESEMKRQNTAPVPELSLEIEATGHSPLDTLPNRPVNPTTTLLTPSIPSSSELFGESAHATSTVRGSLETSTALHEDLSKQLAQMATQLRRNAEQFSETLAKDTGVVNAAQEKIERNYDEVSKERIRLRDHSAKSSGTTCLTFMAIIVVIIAFFMTYLIIRVT